ncbi:MAG: biotin-dependent carboxyltransferase family protein, partial [Cyclobacteriaceae bacterium]|nr:biotin-dependent carboxyltransferase family protein [Cyclobacteriaceae bacterium]
FPAPTIQFNQAALLCLAGADFGAMLDDKSLAVHQPFVVLKGSVLFFTKWKTGSYAYLAVQGGFVLDKWKESYSTNLKVKAGGWQGRKLKKGDEIHLKTILDKSQTMRILPWLADIRGLSSTREKIRIVLGNEWNWLSKTAQKTFIKKQFLITKESDRMGYRLKGEKLSKQIKEELISSAVSFGTLQLLPDGQVIILMADHQTTGGYPRIAHVISADRSALAQLRPGETLSFEIVSLAVAEEAYLAQVRGLQQLVSGSRYQLKANNLIA